MIFFSFVVHICITSAAPQSPTCICYANCPPCWPTNQELTCSCRLMDAGFEHRTVILLPDALHCTIEPPHPIEPPSLLFSMVNSSSGNISLTWIPMYCTGWMMWNWEVTALYTGCSLVLYDGSPLHPHNAVMWDLVDKCGVTIFGTSAKWIGEQSFCVFIKFWGNHEMPFEITPQTAASTSPIPLIMSCQGYQIRNPSIITF